MEEEIVCNRWKDLTGDQINGPAVQHKISFVFHMSRYYLHLTALGPIEREINCERAVRIGIIWTGH